MRERRTRTIPSEWLKTLRVVHRWTGLILSLYVLLISLTGGLLLFKKPYYRSQFPELKRPLEGPSLLAYTTTLRQLESNFVDPGIQLIQFPQPGMNAFHLWLKDGSQLLAHSDSGRILTRWRWYQTFPGVVTELHTHLAAGTMGATLNGILGMLLLLLLLSSPWLWWPRRGLFHLKKWLPRSLSVRNLLGSHEVNGLLAFPLLILFVLTGVSMIFFPTVSSLLSQAFDAHSPERLSATVEFEEMPRKDWTEILPVVEENLPEGRTVFFYPGDQENAVLTFRKRMPGEWHPNGRSYLLIDPYSGSLVQKIDARTQGTGTRISQAIYPLHAAMLGSLLYQGFALLAALVLVALTWTGLLSYVNRRSLLGWCERGDSNPHAG